MHIQVAAGSPRRWKGGADIVITGRAADPALTVAPLIHEFGKSYDDFEFLGKATLAGHLLECAGQVSGGYFADPGVKDVHELWNLGFPIAEVDAGGNIRISKLPDTGGEISERTVKEQLLYELHDPANYLTPDVVADFSGVTVASSAAQTVAVTGATGRRKTGRLKVSVGYLDGFVGEGEISYGGAGAEVRARLAADVVRSRIEATGLDVRDLRFDLIGVNSLFGGPDASGHPRSASCREVRLRVAGRAESEAAARGIGREVEALYTNGPAGGGGARTAVRQAMSIESILVAEADVDINVRYLEV